MKRIMLPKPEEVLIEAIKKENKSFSIDELKSIKGYQMTTEAMREYGKRLLDHVAESAESRPYGHDKQSILKIKDEL